VDAAFHLGGIKMNYKKIGIICLSGTLTLSSLGCTNVSKGAELSNTKIEIEDTVSKEEIEETSIEKSVVAEDTKPTDEQSNVEVNSKEEVKEETKTSKTTESIEQEEYSEEEVITYFENLETDIYNELVKSDNSVLERIQKKCAHFILFMSNEEEIKGYTWSTLTDESKKEITSIFLRVDEKVSASYPNYTDKIKTYSKKASTFITDTYEKMKEKTNTYIDEKVDETTQEEIKESFQEGYEDLKDSITNTKEKVKQWARDKGQ
jgi:hypothetical protein